MKFLIVLAIIATLLLTNTNAGDAIEATGCSFRKGNSVEFQVDDKSGTYHTPHFLVEIKVQYKPEEAEDESEEEKEENDLGDETEFKFKFETNDKISFESEFHAGTETHLKLRIDSIIEFADTGDKGYDAETIVSQLDFGDVTWNAMNCSCATIDGKEVNQCFAESDTGIYKVTVYYADMAYGVDKAIITPDLLKFTVEIKGFNYTNSANSLALEVEIISEVDLKDEDDDDKETDSSTETDDEDQPGWAYVGTPGSSFRWDSKASCDGTACDIVASKWKKDGEKSDKAWFTFDAPGAASIVWDPVLGPKTTKGLSGWELFAIIAGAIAVLGIGVAGLVFYRRRNNN